MILKELLKTLYKDQLVAICGQNSSNLLWVGAASLASESAYADSKVISVDLAGAAFQPKHLTQTEVWNILYVQIEDICNVEGFNRLCYALYLNYWSDMHMFVLGAQPVCFEEFMTNEYYDEDIMRTVLSGPLFKIYLSFKED